MSHTYRKLVEET